MRRRENNTEITPRMLTQTQAEIYAGMGRPTLTAFAIKIGARRKFGRSVRYDRAVIDAAFDAMDSGNDSFTGAGGQ